MSDNDDNMRLVYHDENQSNSIVFTMSDGQLSVTVKADNRNDPNCDGTPQLRVTVGTDDIPHFIASLVRLVKDMPNDDGSLVPVSVSRSQSNVHTDQTMSDVRTHIFDVESKIRHHDDTLNDVSERLSSIYGNLQDLNNFVYDSLTAKVERLEQYLSEMSVMVEHVRGIASTHYHNRTEQNNEQSTSADGRTSGAAKGIGDQSV